MPFKPFEEAIRNYCEKNHKRKDDLLVSNAVIKAAHVALERHVNAIMLELGLELADHGHITALCQYQQRAILGVVVEDMLTQFASSSNETVWLDELNGKPVRVILESYMGPVIGLGHFLDDKFIMFEDYLKEKIVQVTDMLCDAMEHAAVRKGEGQCTE